MVDVLALIQEFERITKGGIPRITTDGKLRLEISSVDSSSNQPITILNFTDYLGQIYDSVNTFNANWQVVINNQNDSLQNEMTIINTLRDQTEAIAQVGTKIDTLNTNIGNVVDLMKAIIQALSMPKNIGLDTTSISMQPQVIPNKPGP